MPTPDAVIDQIQELLEKRVNDFSDAMPAVQRQA